MEVNQDPVRGELKALKGVQITDAREDPEDEALFEESKAFVDTLKTIAAAENLKWLERRPLEVRLASGNSYSVNSPVFIQRRPKQAGRPSGKPRKNVLRHLGLELLGFVERASPVLASTVASMAVLTPSFEVATRALGILDISASKRWVRQLTYQLAEDPMAHPQCLVEPTHDTASGQRILVCIDGGRIRERTPKKGAKPKGAKRQGYQTDWIEPRMLTLHWLDEEGRIDPSHPPIYDGAFWEADEFFDILQTYLEALDVTKAKEITFCLDGAPWMWSRLKDRIAQLGVCDDQVNLVLDYTHAKQNLEEIVEYISRANRKRISENQVRKALGSLLYAGDIEGIRAYIEQNAPIARWRNKAIKKLDSYFADASKFQYHTLQERGVPIGSGSVESAIRRVINLRIKSSGSFWLRENAETIMFLRSAFLSRRWHRVTEFRSNRLRNILNQYEQKMAA